MNEQQPPTLPDDGRTIAFGDAISTMTLFFVPDVEDDEWAWWPASHNFYTEWDSGALPELALDTAFRFSFDDVLPETLEQAIAIAQEGLAILAACEVEEPCLPFRLLLGSLEGKVLRDFEESASVLAGCFDLGELLSQERPDLRRDIIAEELYGASGDWAIPLVFGLVGLKLRLLGPAFDRAMQTWYDRLLARARAHYLSSEAAKE